MLAPYAPQTHDVRTTVANGPASVSLPSFERP